MHCGKEKDGDGQGKSGWKPSTDNKVEVQTQLIQVHKQGKDERHYEMKSVTQ